MFPGVSAALLTRIFERKLKATELIRLKEKSVTDLDQEDRVFKMTESGGAVGFKKTAPSLKDWGPNPQIWTGCFLTYLAAIGYLFGDKYPKAVPNMLMFMRQILDFAQTYHWSEAVLPLALNFHQYILDKGELSTDSYLVTAQFREKYLRHNLTLPAKSPPHSPGARPRQARRARSSNNETEVCGKFNTTGCLWEGCKRRHECTYPVFNPELPKLEFSPSPLHTQSWSNFLRYYPGNLGPTLVGILTHGVQIGYRGKRQSYHSTNHHIHEPNIITEKLAEDLRLCRVRLTSEPSFISPLGLVPKQDGGWRRIHDLSWPPDRGVNQGIPDSWSTIEYMNIDDIYDQVVQAGPGCTIIKRDIKDAFRIVPVAEDNQHLLAFRWNDSTYVECCLPFGLATAPFLFNLFAEALHWILQCLLPAFYMNHYLDDFIAITRSPSVSDPAGAFDEVYNIVTDRLGIPRNTKKDEQGTCVAVLGIQIDSIAMEARLPPEKLCRATLDAAAALNAASLSLKQTESLTGLLAFCSRVVRLGRTRLQALYTFQAAFPRGKSARRRIPYEVRDDLKWWRDSLSLFNGVLLIDPCRRHITHLYTDASTTDQGLFFFSSKSTSDCWLAHCHQLHASNAATLALAQDAHAHINTNELNAGHLKLLWNGLGANTRSVYLSAQRNYERHCALQNLPAWPASRHSLILWLTSRLLGNSGQKSVKPDTALADLAALRAYHIDNFLDDKLFYNRHFRRLIDGARRLSPTAKVRVRKPISREAITALSAGLDTLPLQPSQMTVDLRDDLNFAAACRVAFAGFLRVGEFTYKREDLGTPSIFLATKLTRSDIRFSSSSDHAQLTLKRSKTDRRHEGVQIILARTGDGACPVDALQKLLLLDPKEHDAPLFSFHRRPFSRSNSLSTLSTKLRTLGLQTDGYSGHSFRKGAAQHAHDSGILNDQIQMLGRWTSEAFRVYFTTNASVLYQLNHQFQTGSPAPLSLVQPPSPPPS
ncbi:hypothetical protein MRS44_017830 [Fusarium solani]|uniref:uncharacterized protein n=1 Tax=Fusarium solani TaxID=169388 RepID=UPI0032C45783|nr:hypothetical protein MRS44_017830 [Fusarium solani]